MILQESSAGGRWFAMRNLDHAAVAGELALRFGNADFERLPEQELVAEAARHHDSGWCTVDDPPLRNAATGLPYRVPETPHPLIVFKAMASAEGNERVHPFLGLMASMHGWGVYNGRMGVSDKHVFDHVPDADRPVVDRMLGHEQARQKRLLDQLGDSPLGDERYVRRSYKLVQFVDTLALYFQDGVAPCDWEPDVFANVPESADADVELTVRPVGDGVVAVDPYPFAVDRVELVCRGRWLEPQADDAAFAEACATAPVVERRFTIVRG